MHQLIDQKLMTTSEYANQLAKEILTSAIGYISQLDTVSVNEKGTIENSLLAMDSINPTEDNRLKHNSNQMTINQALSELQRKCLSFEQYFLTAPDIQQYAKAYIISKCTKELLCEIFRKDKYEALVSTQGKINSHIVFLLCFNADRQHFHIKDALAYIHSITRQAIPIDLTEAVISIFKERYQSLLARQKRDALLPEARVIIKIETELYKNLAIAVSLFLKITKIDQFIHNQILNLANRIFEKHNSAMNGIFANLSKKEWDLYDNIIKLRLSANEQYEVFELLLKSLDHFRAINDYAFDIGLSNEFNNAASYFNLIEQGLRSSVKTSLFKFGLFKTNFVITAKEIQTPDDTSSFRSLSQP
jgi:hypothetical protein